MNMIARSVKPIAAFLSASFCFTIAASPVSAGNEDAELIYECALALDFAAKKGVGLPVKSSRAMAQFGEVTGNDAAAQRDAEKAIDAVWTDYKKSNGRAALDDYVLGVAQDCAALYSELAEQESAVTEGQLNAQGTLSAAALRSYANRTGDYPAVADYLVYFYPHGKDLFKENADGDYLGQMIVELGAGGLKQLSDETVYAIANKFYWQYNPPATRLISAEYQRRMRVLRHNENEAQQWAQRAAEDRARQAREANARPVGSLGNGQKYRPRQGSGLVTCTTWANSRRVCKED